MIKYNKVCNRCHVEKDCKQFAYSRKLHARNSICTDCTGVIVEEYDKAEYNKYARQYRKTSKNLTYENTFRKQYLQSIKGVASKLYSSAKSRALSKNIDFNLTTEWIISQLIPMRCSLTDIQLSINKYENKTFRVNPYSPSIDRKDPSKGYTQDNCRIVCWIYNLCKGDFNDQIVLDFAKSLILQQK